MKRIICFVIMVFTCVFLCACSSTASENSYLRIHIRANSNSQADQDVKYEIRDLVVAYLTPKVKTCNSIDEVKKIINSESSNVTSIIDKHLVAKGFNYSSSIKINNEFFPTRTYGDLTLEANYYDAIIINLGLAEGNNWWCVVYPPLCFTGNNIVYKSKIVELIQKYL